MNCGSTWLSSLLSCIISLIQEARRNAYSWWDSYRIALSGLVLLIEPVSFVFICPQLGYNFVTINATKNFWKVRRWRIFFFIRIISAFAAEIIFFARKRMKQPGWWVLFSCLSTAWRSILPRRARSFALRKYNVLYTFALAKTTILWPLDFESKFAKTCE